MIATVGTAYAVVVTAVADPRSVEGLEFERAVEYLPSIASREMRAWLERQESTQDPVCGVVIPGSRRFPALRRLPNREVCVPSAEYLLFAEAVRTDVRARLPAAANSATADDSRKPLSDSRFTASNHAVESTDQARRSGHLGDATESDAEPEARPAQPPREQPIDLSWIAAAVTGRR